MEKIWKKYITFSVPIKKEGDNGQNFTYKLNFIDSFRFMSALLSELVDNMSRIFNTTECKSCIEKIKINSERCFVGLKNNRLIYRCKECKEEWKRLINELIEKFPSIYQFCNGDLNKFVLLLRKGVYPYEVWITGKNLMKPHLNLEDISDEEKYGMHLK